MRNLSLPSLLTRLEYLALFIGTLILYSRVEGSWLLFVLLILVPDVSMLGYLANPRVGSLVYDMAHFYVLPLILLAIALMTGWLLGLHLSLIWLAHISMDRVVGYGLKYATAFKDTHLQRI